MIEHKVGVVILNYNGSEFLDVTLDSLTRAVCKTPFIVGILDNGSNECDEKKCRKICNHYFEETHSLQGFYISSQMNLGFSGGNNVLIKRFLEDDTITHLCLLNSDIIVTTGWLDRLIKVGKLAIGPVTNATGNEQTVSTDYEVELSKDAFADVDQFAQKRYSVFENYTVSTEILYFFNTLFSRQVFEKIGLLDEQFFPGSFEDNDFCLRMQNAGIEMFIARGCFVHHFGSGSFSKLDMPKRVDISNQNRKRFEDKWNVKWKDDSWKMLESCRQDIDFFKNKFADKWALDIISSAMSGTEKMIVRWADAIAFYQSSQYAEQILEANNVIASGKDSVASPFSFTLPPLESLSGKQLLRLALKKAILKIKKKLHLNHAQNEENKHNSEGINREDKKFELVLDKINQRKSVCIFAPIFTKENEKDGYIQRIRAIDNTIFKDYFRIYLMGDGLECRQIQIDDVDNDHMFIKFNSYEEDQRQKIFGLVEKCKLTYTHSLLRFMIDNVSEEMCKVFQLPDTFHIWDVHGAVPEEYILNGGELGGRLANDLETYLYKNVDVIVCVNEAMKIHLQKKLGSTTARFIVYPIFTGSDMACKNCGTEKKAHAGKPVIVYSGGLQKWQNIDMMQDIMEKTMQLYQYKVLVPEPAQFKKLWGKRAAMNNIYVDTKAPEQIGEEYRECAYGLVLRDDIVVNHVACPTKIIEYIQYGIIPIFKSENIGDFVRLGMKYVSVQDLLEGKLPQEDERIKIMNNNFRVLDTLKAQQEKGYMELTECLCAHVEEE